MKVLKKKVAGHDFEFSNDLSLRLFDFSVYVIRFLRRLPENAEGRVIKNQLIKSATSSCANYEEAQAGVTKKEFAMKVGISLKEMRETNYWLRIIMATELNGEKELSDLLRESNELRLILGSIISKLHHKANAHA